MRKTGLWRLHFNLLRYDWKIGTHTLVESSKGRLYWPPPPPASCRSIYHHCYLGTLQNPHLYSLLIRAWPTGCCSFSRHSTQASPAHPSISSNLSCWPIKPSSLFTAEGGKEDPGSRVHWSVQYHPPQAPGCPPAPACPPVQDISQRVERLSLMAAILCTCFPEKAQELWAYHPTIIHAEHNCEGKWWVTYDCQFHRQAWRMSISL